MARGSPCVVPSNVLRSYPPVMKSRAGCLQALIANVAKAGRSILVLCYVAALFSALNGWRHQEAARHFSRRLQKCCAFYRSQPHFRF